MMNYYYYEEETRPQYYTQPPPRAHHSSRLNPGVIIEVEPPRRVSPSPTRVVVVEKPRRREEPVGFLPWLCGTFCCCWVCFDCADDCCPGREYDSD
ncbi:hypothetical protein VTI74DRAFT_10125 [Chaetomium olivicolor]